MFWAFLLRCGEINLQHCFYFYSQTFLLNSAKTSLGLLSCDLVSKSFLFDLSHPSVSHKKAMDFNICKLK